MIEMISALSWLLLMGSSVMADDDGLQALFDFAAADAAKGWQVVNDGVMGGVSDGRFRITDSRMLEFSGTLSLENNGGFASVRSKARSLGFKQGDVLVVMVRGDGRAYLMNLYLNRSATAFSYRAAMQTKRDEWMEVRVPLDRFEATSFGRAVRGVGAVKPDQINSVGFMLSDKQAGPFRLEVQSISVQRQRVAE